MGGHGKTRDGQREIINFAQASPALNHLYSYHLRVGPRGRVALSARLWERLLAQGFLELALIADESGEVLLLRRAHSDETGCCIAASAVVEAAQLAQSLRERGVALPAWYLMEWNPAHAVWLGTKSCNAAIGRYGGG